MSVVGRCYVENPVRFNPEIAKPLFEALGLIFGTIVPMEPRGQQGPLLTAR